MNVSQLVGRWYDKNKRYLPWREGKNPYYIWLSEIILQQTRVAQGVPYYNRFIEAYPNIEKLAAASIEEIMILWQGLGYYSRARNLHKTARIIVTEFKGQFPVKYDEIRKLPGIGDYTASAIVSLAYDQPYAAIDGNVYRVMARYLGIEDAIDQTSGRKVFARAANELIDKRNPGRYNQAMIELGALVCLPKNAHCHLCPLKNSCFALQKSSIDSFPVKTKKNKVRNRFFYYLVINGRDTLYIRQREVGDIWALLFDFPLIEAEKELDLKQLVNGKLWKSIFGKSQPQIIALSDNFRHVLSHQVIHARFVELRSLESINFKDSLQIHMKDIHSYPYPRLIHKYLEEKKAL